jgi:hypothetical protein
MQGFSIARHDKLTVWTQHGVQSRAAPDRGGMVATAGAQPTTVDGGSTATQAQPRFGNGEQMKATARDVNARSRDAIDLCRATATVRCTTPAGSDTATLCGSVAGNRSRSSTRETATCSHGRRIILPRGRTACSSIGWSWNASSGACSSRTRRFIIRTGSAMTIARRTWSCGMAGIHGERVQARGSIARHVRVGCES